MSVPLADGAGPLPDSWREVGAALLVIAAVVFGAMLYVQANPGAPWQLEAVYSSAFSVADEPVTAEETLELPQSEAEYLNRVYRDLNAGRTERVGEQAYCIDLVDRRMSVQQAGTIEASEHQVRFTTANCLFSSQSRGLLHFHPPQSRPVLSGPDTAVNGDSNDKESFLASSFEVSCVQAGLMTEDVGDRTRALRCYVKPASGDIDDEFPEVPVEIVAG